MIKLNNVHHSLLLKMSEVTVYMADVSYLVTKYIFVNNDSITKTGSNPPICVLATVSFKLQKNKPPTLNKLTDFFIN